MAEGAETRCTCGIIMPISHVDDDHTEAHWAQVLEFITEAIERADMLPQPVWHNSDFDVIQAKILRNLFENEIIVCDISTRNPNVMLELGMRLTTKRPTIIIAEEGTKLPFDTSVISTEFYNPALKYSDIAAFVDKLAKILSVTRAAALAGTFHTYLEYFEFETVKPSSVSISGEEAIADRLDDMNAKLARMDGRIAAVHSLSLQNPAPSAAFERGHADARIDPAWNTADAIAHLQSAAIDPALVVGARVHHAKFGDGVITETDGHRIDANFDEVGSKRVLASFLKAI